MPLWEEPSLVYTTLRFDREPEHKRNRSIIIFWSRATSVSGDVQQSFCYTKAGGKSMRRYFWALNLDINKCRVSFSRLNPLQCRRRMGFIPDLRKAAFLCRVINHISGPSFDLLLFVLGAYWKTFFPPHINSSSSQQAFVSTGSQSPGTITPLLFPWALVLGFETCV